MLIVRKFDDIIPDNDENYFLLLKGAIESVDELSSMEISKDKNKYSFRISTSLPKYNKTLLNEILKFNTFLNIRLDLSKSIKTTGTISFSIYLDR